MFTKLFNKYIPQKKLYFLLFLIFFTIFLWKNSDIGILLFVTVIFATALNPLVDKLEGKMKRPLATTLVLCGFLLITAIFILPVIYLAVYEIVEFAKAFPQYVNNIDSTLAGISFLKYIGFSNINTGMIATAFIESSSDIFENVLNIAAEASEVLLYIFTAVILLFFFMVDKVQIKTAITKLFPIEYREKTEKIIDTVSKKLSGYIIAQTLVSGSVWVTMTLGLIAFKIKYAFLLGLIAGILSIIPIVGSGISLIVCLIATYEMGLKYLIIVAILYTVSHFIENHVVRPYVYSKFLNLHQVIIFLALIVGAKYQGVLGVILAPPFAMALYILLEELYIKKMEEQEIEG